MSELNLYAPMLEHLVTSRRIREDTLVTKELPLHGRSVDLATLTRSGCLTAYEFKVNDVSRALRQATYNLRSFDRSYVVLRRRPAPERLQVAATLGVGVFVVTETAVELLLRPGPPKFLRAARSRVKHKMHTSGILWGEYVRT